VFADVRGHQAWYDVLGQDGSPVLLIMGFGMSGRVWMPQVETLKKHHRVAIYDSRGVGKSSASEGLVTIRSLADDAAALLDHLKWERAHVVGVSMGGMIAQELALNHRAKMLSLGLIATLSAGGIPHVLPTMEGLRLFAAANFAKGNDRLMALAQLLFPKGTTIRYPQMDSPREEITVPASVKSRLIQLAAILRHDTRKRLPQLAGLPTLVIKPERDVLVRPSHSESMVDRIPGARILRVPDGGHGVTLQHWELVNQSLLEHFSGADGSSPRTSTV
jgi:3-oxoadipate enol-lactonase